MGLVNNLLALFAAGALGLAFTNSLIAHDIQHDTSNVIWIILLDDSTHRGFKGNSPSFGIAAVDLDNIGDDDLVIINRGNIFPALYLNNNGVFKDSFYVLSSDTRGITDRHCSLVLDIDIVLALTTIFSQPSIPNPVSAQAAPNRPDKVRFMDVTKEYLPAGFHTCTFGGAIGDVNGDGKDDLVISNHGNGSPSLLLNQGGYFIDASHLLPEKGGDIHSPRILLLDGDRDRDLIFAAGGSCGVGDGSYNRVYNNLLAETGRLSFEEVSQETGTAYPKWRGRTFFPLANPNNSRLDLYISNRKRIGAPNLYLINKSLENRILFIEDRLPRITTSFDSKGKGIFFDYNLDGNKDFIMLDGKRAVLFENNEGSFRVVNTVFSMVQPVASIAIGDVTNDGWPEIYLGLQTPYSFSDQLSFSNSMIQFVTRNKKDDGVDQINFQTESESIDINFREKRSPLSPDNPSDIYVGRHKVNPASLVTTINADEAEGKPVIGKPGIYLWRNGQSWHILIKYNKPNHKRVGEVYAPGIHNVTTSYFEKFPQKKTEDILYHNLQGNGFEELLRVPVPPGEATRSVGIVDLNNDTWPDIIGIRGSETGRYNGRPFIILNQNGYKFKLQKRTGLPWVKMSQADEILFGCINDDGLIDCVVLNGHGTKPGNWGPNQILLNNTQTTNDYVILDLEGVNSNRDGIGAQIWLYRRGSLIGYRELTYRGRAQDSRKAIMHFGLGKDKGPLEACILWPSGKEQKARIRPNSINYINEKQGGSR